MITSTWHDRLTGLLSKCFLFIICDKHIINIVFFEVPVVQLVRHQPYGLAQSVYSKPTDHL